MTKIDEKIKRAGIFGDTKKKLVISRDRMYALKNENSKVTDNIDEKVRTTAKFYAQLHDINARLENIPYRTDLVSANVLVITIEEIKKR